MVSQQEPEPGQFYCRYALIATAVAMLFAVLVQLLIALFQTQGAGPAASDNSIGFTVHKNNEHIESGSDSAMEGKYEHPQTSENDVDTYSAVLSE